MTKDDARQFNLERACLIEQIDYSRRILAAVQGRLLAEALINALTGVVDEDADRLRKRINALLLSDMFGPVPGEAKR